MIEPVPLSLAIEPGDYRCTWQLPRNNDQIDADGPPREIPGDLELRAEMPIRGSILGEGVPLQWNESAGQRSAGLPQQYVYPTMHGRLSTNQAFAALDVDLQTWLPNRAVVHARAAIISQLCEPLPTSCTLAESHCKSVACIG